MGSLGGSGAIPHDDYTWSERDPTRKRADRWTNPYKACPNKIFHDLFTAFTIGLAASTFGHTVFAAWRAPPGDRFRSIRMYVPTRVMSMSKLFGWWGALFSGSNCALRILRRRDDFWNPILAGFATGYGLFHKGGIMRSMSRAVRIGLFISVLETLRLLPELHQQIREPWQSRLREQAIEDWLDRQGSTLDRAWRQYFPEMSARNAPLPAPEVDPPRDRSLLAPGDRTQWENDRKVAIQKGLPIPPLPRPPEGYVRLPLPHGPQPLSSQAVARAAELKAQQAQEPPAPVWYRRWFGGGSST